MTPHEVAEALRDDVAEGGWHYDTMLLAANMLDAVEAALVIPQPNSQGATLYESGYADALFTVKKALER